MQEQAFHRSDEIDSKKNRYFKSGYNLHGKKNVHINKKCERDLQNFLKIIFYH